MDRIEHAAKRLAIAKSKLEDALLETQDATQAYLKLVAEVEDEHWKKIIESSNGRSRRPKGEIQRVIELIFIKPRPGALQFAEIYQAIVEKTGQSPSKSTVRQTLYRMESRGYLESYSNRWSPGERLKDKMEETE